MFRITDNKRRNVSCLGLIIALVFLTTSPVFAQTQYQIVAGENIESLGGPGATINSGDVLSMRGDTPGSYCCSVHTADSTTDVPRFGSGPYNASPTAPPSFTNGTPRGFVEPFLPMTNFVSPSDLNRARVCFEGNGPVQSANLSFKFGSSGMDPATNVRVRCDETTLFGGFNTSASGFNFLEVTNTLRDQLANVDSTIRFRIRVTSAITGFVLLDLPFDVAAEQRRDVDIGGAVGANQFGAIVLTHDGPPGSIRAVLSQYRNAATDGSLQLVQTAREEYKTRTQLAQ